MGFGSWLKKLGRNVDPFYSKGTVGHVTAPVTQPVSRVVRAAGRQIDLTSSKSLGGLGRYVAPIARPAIATAAAAVTGGASVIAGERGAISKSAFGVKSTAEGYAVGAGVGLAVLGGKTIGQAVAGAAAGYVKGTDENGRAPVAAGGQENATADGEGGSFLAALLRFMFPTNEPAA